MTLDSETGGQLGARLEFNLAPGHIPIDILWAFHFLDEESRGTEPSPFILFEDYLLNTRFVTYAPDGTPAAGTPANFYLPVTVGEYGHATAMTEMPGSVFLDGEPRLFVGTEFGSVLSFVHVIGVGMVLDGVIPVHDFPVLDLEPIPQYGYLSLGVLTDNTIYGLDLQPGLRNRKDDRYSLVYALSDPRPTTLTDIEVFGVTDEPLVDPDDTVDLVLADGTTDLALTEISATLTGMEMLTVTVEQMAHQLTAIASGSLLMLHTDGSAVSFDPAYSEDGGSSGCQVDVTDGVNDNCGFLRADADADMDVEMSDAIFTLRALYVPGSDSLSCTDAGDSDDNGSVEMADAVYTLKHLYVPDSPAPPFPFPECGGDPTADDLSCADHPCMVGPAPTRAVGPGR